MKTTTIFATGALTVLAALAPMNATADVMDGLGVWEGAGTVHAMDGSDLGRFSVSVTRKSVGNAKVRSDGLVTLPNGQVIKFWQEIESTGSGAFRIVSSNGFGEGRCFANGICESQEHRPDRHSFATTMVRDAPDKIRILTTETEKGHGLRFMEQTLTKKR